jgi:AcrR family transcriptional regulator
MSTISGSPASGRRPRISHDEARRRIAAAAERLLATQRFHELTVDSVMTEAGPARTVFYRHFTDLPQVILELLEELRLEVLEQPVAEDAVSDPETLRALLSRTVDFFAAHGRLITALEDGGRSDPALETAHRAFMTRSVDKLTTLLETEIAAGRIAALPAREVARALFLLNASYLLDVFGRTTGDRADALETLWTIWSRTLRPMAGH